LHKCYPSLILIIKFNLKILAHHHYINMLENQGAKEFNFLMKIDSWPELTNFCNITSGLCKLDRRRRWSPDITSGLCKLDRRRRWVPDNFWSLQTRQKEKVSAWYNFWSLQTRQKEKVSAWYNFWSLQTRQKEKVSAWLDQALMDSAYRSASFDLIYKYEKKNYLTKKERN